MVTIAHGRITVAVIAMMTLSVMFINCSLPPRCEVMLVNVAILLSIIGTMLGVELFGALKR